MSNENDTVRERAKYVPTIVGLEVETSHIVEEPEAQADISPSTQKKEILMRADEKKSPEVFEEDVQEIEEEPPTSVENPLDPGRRQASTRRAPLMLR